MTTDGRWLVLGTTLAAAAIGVARTARARGSRGWWGYDVLDGDEPLDWREDLARLAGTDPERPCPARLARAEPDIRARISRIQRGRTPREGRRAWAMLLFAAEAPLPEDLRDTLLRDVHAETRALPQAGWDHPAERAAALRAFAARVRAAPTGIALRGAANTSAALDRFPSEPSTVGVRTFWHGTSVPNARRILRQGWDPRRFGDRQRALRGGEPAPEVRGVYVTNNRAYAQAFYGMPDDDFTNPGRGGGAVVQVQVEGPMIGGSEWWRLRRQVEQALVDAGEPPLRMYDDRKQSVIDRTVERAQALGYVGYADGPQDGEFVVFDPKDARIVEARGSDGRRIKPV